MNFQLTAFEYQSENLSLFAFSWNDPLLLSGLVASVLLLWVAYLVAPYAYGYMIVRREERLKLQKKDTIKDLILMKEIQGELEQEMEQAMLNAAFSS